MSTAENPLDPSQLFGSQQESSLQDSKSDADLAIDAARLLLERSRQLQTPQERRQQAELDRMISHPGDKATLVEMTDQAFRTHSPARVADQLTHLLDLQGIPRFFSPLEQTMLRGFQSFGAYLPGVAVPLVKEKMRQETANVILPAEEEMLRSHLAERQKEGVRMNVNYLGEALLGEKEAQRRLQHYLHALQIPEVTCLSVKLSTLFSQVNPIDPETTLRVVTDRLELLYRAATRESFIDHQGNVSTKFVYLDMEEYRDLHLTAEAFQRTLDRSDMESVQAGIALQAYVPDSFGVMQKLLQWSAGRVKRGGKPITVRLVKGANMEMERVEASIAGWQQAPYDEKIHTDANFKRMLRHLVDAAAAGDARVGVASHNLFDIALALLWGSRTASSQGSTLDRMQFEMLEGMANHQRRALLECAPAMLLYAPACHKEDFLNAIGYLIRRLDENTGEENFLRHTFDLKPDTEAWHELADGFRSSVAQMETVSSSPRRTQNRYQEPDQPPQSTRWQEFKCESDTDWSLPHHADWATHIVDAWQPRVDEHAEVVPLLIGDQVREFDSQRPQRESPDPSRPDRIACRFTQASERDVLDAIEIAHADPEGWRSTSLAERSRLLRQTAQFLRMRRADLIGAMMIDGGKTITEADAELSEAVDFTEFYPLSARDYIQRGATPRGVVAVISPWNFPCAIPCGGVVAALAAGNTVLLKPASDTVLPAFRLAQCFWDAGIPRSALQLIPCSGSGAGQLLVTDDRVDTVVMTGGTETARQMLGMRPGLRLIAETGGKNATIVTALSDRDLAIKHVLHSAFGHSGQKCSATSLLLLQREVYDDPAFRASLADATESLPVGSVWDLSTRVGPLIRPPSGDLAQGLKELEPGEDWLVMPRRSSSNRHLYSPGIKWNVQPNSFTHRTELFGPVLGVMSFDRLEQAIQTVNATGYGLTSGLESLDDREQQLWLQHIRAGNLYVNRPTTGAIVLRQPFGGLGSSGYGPGAKAGGPHYVVPLLRFDEVHPQGSSLNAIDETQVPEAITSVLDATASTTYSVTPELQAFAEDAARFSDETLLREHDHFSLVGQDNLRSYVPVRQLRVRLEGSESAGDVIRSMTAAAAAQCNVTYSIPPGHPKLSNALAAIVDRAAMDRRSSWHAEWIEETDERLVSEISDGRVDRLRLLEESATASTAIRNACREVFLTVMAESVAEDAEVEILRYVHEQSLSHDYHRYGNLGRRGNGEK